jgi:SAM-dependent methyltransferase
VTSIRPEDVRKGPPNIDYARPFTEEEIRAGRHRHRVGGKWDEMGPRQLEFLREQGLRPHHRLLDVGCGPLRAGRLFVDYLDPGHYYGIDVNASLLDAGYELELPEALRAKLPREHLRATKRFDCDFGVPFDFAIANSVFTHVSLNKIRLCLHRLAQSMQPGGRFFATFFYAPLKHPLDLSRNDGRRWTERNAFFYYVHDLRWAATWGPWKLRYIGDWGHPGGQRMVEFRRTRDIGRARALVRRAAARALSI